MIQAPLPAYFNQEGMLPYSRILVEGARDLFGLDHLAKVLREMPSQTGQVAVGEYSQAMSWEEMEQLVLSFSQEDALSFPVVLERLYGVRGGRGLSVLVGRAAFTYVLKHFGKLYGLKDSDFRLLPVPRRIQAGLGKLAQIFEQQFEQQAVVRDEGTYWTWTVENCLNCRGQSAVAGEVSCYFIVGLLQEYLSWASGGRFYPVVEMECAVLGGNCCVFRIDRKPLD